MDNCKCNHLKGTLTPMGQITGTIKEGAAPGGTYAGPYDVIPQVDPQQLETYGKVMRDNVTVWGIPYTEVSNEYGTTVTIAES